MWKPDPGSMLSLPSGAKDQQSILKRSMQPLQTQTQTFSLFKNPKPIPTACLLCPDLLSLLLRPKWFGELKIHDTIVLLPPALLVNQMDLSIMNTDECPGRAATGHQAVCQVAK